MIKRYKHNRRSHQLPFRLVTFYLRFHPVVLTPFLGLHRQRGPAVPPGALLALPLHAHRRGRQHGEADATVSRAHVQPAALHALRAEHPLEDRQRGENPSGHRHLHGRNLHS